MVRKAKKDGLDHSHPVIMRVGIQKGSVVWQIGDLVIGVPPETAQQFAEETLKAVGGIMGKKFFLTTIGIPKGE